MFGTRNALAIRAMLKKWEMETDCGPDACKIGGQIVKEMTEKEAEHGDPVVL